MNYYLDICGLFILNKITKQTFSKTFVLFIVLFNLLTCLKSSQNAKDLFDLLYMTGYR